MLGLWVLFAVLLPVSGFVTLGAPSRNVYRSDVVSTQASPVRARTVMNGNMPEFDMSPLHKNVVVVGGSGGLGLQVVKTLKKREANVIATTRSGNDELNATGVNVLEGIDVTEEEAVDKLVEKTRSILGDQKVDFLIIIAGILKPDTFEDPKYEGCHMMYDVCVLGPLRVINKMVLSGLLANGSKIGMITSEGGSIGIRTDKEGGGSYGHHMSKCAQNMMGKLLSLDLKPKGIPVVCLHPGFMKTKMTEVYSDKYDELGAVEPEESAPGIIEAVQRLNMDNTGQFIAPFGSYSLGLGIYALEDPDSYGPFSQLPW